MREGREARRRLRALMNRDRNVEPRTNGCQCSDCRKARRVWRFQHETS